MPKGDGLLVATSRREEAFPPIGIIVNWLAALNPREGSLYCGRW